MENIEGSNVEVGRAEAPEVSEASGSESTGAASWVESRVVNYLVGAAVVGFVFWWLQFSTASICCGDFDGYYHVKWSRMLWESIRAGNFPPLFTQLPLTTLNARDYVDHHFLFHVLQIPFTWFRDPVLGAKIGTTLFASLAVLSCYWLVVRYRLRYPLLWLLALLASSAPFLYRMNMAKAMSVSIVLMVAGIYLLFERKYAWLAPLAFLFALAYDMFALLCLAAVVWSVVVFWSERRIEWQPVVWTAVGSLAGFIINPYFPRNIRLFVEHLLMKMTKDDFPVKVGGEWYPYESWEFLMNAFVACVAMVVGYIAFRGDDRKTDARPLFFLIFTTVLLIANARWKRFSEYWPPFAVLFAAFSLQPVLSGARRAVASRLPSSVMDELEPFLDRHERPETVERRERARWKELAFVFVVFAYLTAQLVGNVRHEVLEIANSAPPEHYRAATDWIRSNVPKGEMIFNTDWDDFPRLFYFAPEYTYVSGLDPTYLHDKNPELSELFQKITTGEENNPGPIIRDRFGSRYVFTDNEHESFYNNALDSGWFDEVYADDEATVLRIRDAKGAPPPIPEEEMNEEEDQNAQEPEPTN
ncbi:MAG TPA: hypothetical protein VGB73_20605 [Pyrinomonadaceae bacterium]|jgi:hypothetical protein